MNVLVEVDKDLIGKYRGGPYDRLSDESKFFTALSWDNYPAQSFDNLVKAVKPLNIQWAELIENHGINYLVLAEGDSFCASGFVSKLEIAVDTEEWHASIGQSEFIAASEDFKNEWEQLREFIKDFDDEVCQEILEILRQ